MKLVIKIVVIALILAVLMLAAFALWGGRFEEGVNYAGWFAKIRPYAWAMAIGLLVADLLLPLPATAIMAALGSVYGVLTGTMIAVVGSTLSAITAYALARLAGKRGAAILATEDELAKFKSFFDKWGGGAIIISRALPILPEVMSLLAGLARMSFSRFVVAVLLGTIPTSLLFAYIGATAVDKPWWGIVVASLVPLALWPLFLIVIRKRKVDE